MGGGNPAQLEIEMSVQDDVEVKTKTKSKVQIRPPVDYKVIYINDEVTTMGFVIESLVTVFDYTEELAFQATQKIHEDGSAVVAVLPYEIAEQKGLEVTMMARNQAFPLQITLEPAE